MLKNFPVQLYYLFEFGHLLCSEHGEHIAAGSADFLGRTFTAAVFCAGMRRGCFGFRGRWRCFFCGFFRFFLLYLLLLYLLFVSLIKSKHFVLIYYCAYCSNLNKYYIIKRRARQTKNWDTLGDLIKDGQLRGPRQ